MVLHLSLPTGQLQITELGSVDIWVLTLASDLQTRVRTICQNEAELAFLDTHRVLTYNLSKKQGASGLFVQPLLLKGRRSLCPLIPHLAE